MKKDNLIKLINKLHPSEYSTESKVLKKHCIDWRGEYEGKSQLIIFPRSVKKISEILNFVKKKLLLLYHKEEILDWLVEQSQEKREMK